LVSKKKPVGPVDVSAFLAEIRAGKVKERTRTVQVYLDPDAADEANGILEELDDLDRSGPSAEVAISEPDGHVERRAELEALYDDCANRFRDSLADFTFRAERLGDGDAVEAAMLADGVDPANVEWKMAYRIAHHSVEPKMTAADVAGLMPVVGTQQMLKMVAACEAVLRVPAPLSRRPSPGPVTPTL
jgi:hypothetical protein